MIPYTLPLPPLLLPLLLLMLRLPIVLWGFVGC